MTEEEIRRRNAEALRALDEIAAMGDEEEQSNTLDALLSWSAPLMIAHEPEVDNLSNRDRDLVLAALSDIDAQPNAALLRSAERCKRYIGGGAKVGSEGEGTRTWRQKPPLL